MSPTPSFVEVMQQLQEGRDEAAVRVFDQFGRRLIGLAREQLSHRLRQKVDPEDVVQSAFGSFFADAVRRPPPCASWDSLWAWLACITARKCRKWVDHYLARKRDLGREVAPPADGTPAAWAEVTGRDLPPDEAAIAVEEVEIAAAVLNELLTILNPRDRQIVVLHLGGASNPEIATTAGVSERTVQRVLKEAREWLATKGDRSP